LRKLWLIIPGLVAVVALAFLAQPTGTANADNGPHIKGWGATPDGCAACHRVHRGVNDFLLVEEVESLCASCHGNSALGSVLNVMAGSNEANGGALRAGGFETARINTTDQSLPISTVGTAESGAQCRNGIDDDADTVVDDGCPVTIGALAAASAQPTQSKHSTDGSAQTIWGNGAVNAVANPGLAGEALTCGNCHDPHGNGNYRILRSIPGGSGGAGYTVPDTYPKATADYSTANYFNMYFGATPANPMTEPPGAVPGTSILYDTSNWCAQCHTRYLAEQGTDSSGKPASGGSRVDSGDAIFKFRHTSMGYGYSTRAPAGFKYNTRACITCHATHGSNATASGSFSGSVPLPDNTVGAGAADSRLLKMDNRGVCQKCHNQ